jgi:hypothetical protein
MALAYSAVQWYGHGIQCSAVAMAWITVHCGGIDLDYIVQCGNNVISGLQYSAVSMPWAAVKCGGGIGLDLQCSAVVLGWITVQCGGIGLDYSAVRWYWAGLQCSAVVMDLDCGEMRWYWHGVQCSAMVMAWTTVQCGVKGMDYSAARW